jgi:hypothetical protein
MLGASMALVACGGDAKPATNNSQGVSSNFGVDTISSSSSSSSSSKSFSSSSLSSFENHLPEAKTAITVQGLTVHVDATTSTDVDGDLLTYFIDYGDGKNIQYGDAWHTYANAGTYSVRVSVSDGKSTSDKVDIVVVQKVDGNSPPVARLASFGDLKDTYASGGPYWFTSFNLSYDVDKDSLTYRWDVAGKITQTHNFDSEWPCPHDREVKAELITLTVSDGKLFDTVQGQFLNGDCTPASTGRADDMAHPNFTYRVEGLTVYLNALSSSYNTTEIYWDYGDGTPNETGFWLNFHTYKQPGTYNIVLRNTNSRPSYFRGSKEIMVVVP